MEKNLEENSVLRILLLSVKIRREWKRLLTAKCFPLTCSPPDVNIFTLIAQKTF